MDISGPFVGVDVFAVLMCSADSRPDCDFLWYRNNNSTTVIKTGPSLAFAATPANNGNYICVARNPVTKISMYKSKLVNVTGE